jgi:hypothetical protein
MKMPNLEPPMDTFSRTNDVLLESSADADATRTRTEKTEVFHDRLGVNDGIVTIDEIAKRGLIIRGKLTKFWVIVP